MELVILILINEHKKRDHSSAGQNHNSHFANRSFENVAQFRYLGTIITNRNLIQEKIKRRLN
jgi:hypothetical protein